MSGVFDDVVNASQRVLDLFCGAGGMSLGCEQAGYDVLAGVDYDETAIETYNYNFDHEGIQADLSKLDPHAFANQYDIRPDDVDIVVGGPPCLPEGHPIITTDGYVDISDVSVGQQVLTHNGNYKEVIDRGGKQYDDELVVLDLKYRPEPIRLTPEHPVRTADGWKPAGEITNDDHIQFPKTPSYGVERNEFTYETIVNQFTTHEQTLPISGPWVWNFVGRYMADGWRRKTDGDYEITLGVHEDSVDDVVDSINNAWSDQATWTEDTEGKGVKVTFCNEGVWKFLEQFGDGAHDKALPKWVFELPNAWLDAFLDGYLKHDGSESDERLRYSSVSRELAENIQRIYHRVNNVLPSVRLEEHTGSSEINGREVERNDIYVGQMPKSGNNHNCLRKDAENLYVPVFDVSREQFSGTVYNLEVADDNSYSLPLASVHNCQGFSTANQNRDEDDPRNNLVFRFANYVDYYRPDAFVMENVTGIESIDDGETIDLLYDEFEASGYSVNHQTLNAADYGVPQKRRRVFFIGVHESVGDEPQFPEPTHAPADQIDQTEQQGAFSDIATADD